MPDYSKLQNSAKSLIASFGSDWVHRKLTKGAYNPATNTQTTTTTTNTTVKAVRLEYTDSQIDGEVIQKGDIYLYVEAVNLAAPNVQDQMVFGSEIWQIENIKKIQPGSTVVYYEMQLRQ